MYTFFMKRAIELAKKGRGSVTPNPLVGAVIVKDGKIIGEGYHERYGTNHAEVNAFNNASEDVSGATIYVTLEPCSHYGNTPPCADKIIEKRISKVVVGSLDPNPLVSGRGIERIREAGIEVIIGVLEEECLRLNEIFMKYIVDKKPYVIMKSAMSLDGKIATAKGESKWITGEKARLRVQELRNDITAIMVGVNTVKTDDPELTCRLEGGVNPIRIIVDSSLRIPIDSKIVKTAHKIRTIIATTINASKEDIKRLEEKNIEVLLIKDNEDRVDLVELMKVLGEKKIDSILLEGGATLNSEALKSGIVNKVQIYIAPKIIGGDKARGPVGGMGIDKLCDAYKVNNISYEVIGDDILIEGYIEGDEKACLPE